MKPIIIDALIGNDYTICLAEAISDQGQKVTLITPSNRKFIKDYKFVVKKWMPSKDIKDNNISKIFNYLRYLLKATLFLLKQKEDSVVHFQFFRFKLDILFLCFLHLLRIRIVYTAHNVLPHEEKKADYFLYSILYRAADGIITHSGGIKEKLVSRFNIPPNKVTVIPHGNFDSYLPKKTITKEEARKDFNLSIKDDVLLFFGYIREYKGLDLLLNAFKLILEKKPDTVLIIAGFPATKQLYDKYIREVNLLPKKNIKATFNFIPSEDVPKYFISADFVVLPYKKIDHSGIVHMAILLVNLLLPRM